MVCYQVAEKFTRALSNRKKSAGFMRSLMLQRLCSSYTSGLATAEKLLSGGVPDDEEMELELSDEHLDFVDEEVRQLQAIIDVLSPHPTDPKLDAVLYYLLERPDPWLPKGCIIFSQYFDTAKWVGEERLQALLQESLSVATKTEALKPRDLNRVIVDTTVQPKNVMFPTDARLLNRGPRDPGPAGSRQAGRASVAVQPDWHWLLDGLDSPWYPTVRLNCQKSPGDWSGVVASLAAEFQRGGRFEKQELAFKHVE